MSLLYDVLFTWKCKNTHHKLALDALRHLQADDAERWRDLFLTRIEDYLKGAKAPDDDFKDFRNHVLHVGEKGWGGAIEATEGWYKKLVEALTAEKWREAAYNAGVLSHYFSDPLMPLHTGQSEAEGAVHRAVEWSVARSYGQLQELLENGLGGYPKVEIPTGARWLADMVRQGAEEAHQHYDALIDHYDLARGVKDPPAGLDDDLRGRLAPLLGRAAVGFARVLERAIKESGVRPPAAQAGILGVLAGMTIPLFWVTRKLAEVRERSIVDAIHREFLESGKVLTALPEDDKTVRRLHAEEVLKVPLEKLDAQVARAPGSKHEGRARPRPKDDAEPVRFEEVAAGAPGGALKFQLDKSMSVEEAPSIGPKTARRLARLGVTTVGELLELDPDDAAQQMAAGHINASTVRDWQAQARLGCRVPALRDLDCQMLVACDVREAEQLATARPADLLAKVEAYLATPEGDRALRSARPPDLKQVRGWIDRARQARPLQAA